MNHLFSKLSALALLLLFSGIRAGVFAQTGTVGGMVLDQQSREPVLFANVVLVNAHDSTQVMGTPSSDSGSFQFKRVPAGNYFVQVAVLGYHRSNSPRFTIDAEHRNIRLEPIEMTSAAVQLDKVVVRAKRPLMEMEAGKITMNISQSIVTQADNAFEMLKKFPGVTIDKDDNISLNGKSGIMVMVDDRPTHLDGQNLANYLRSMPGSTVDKIEVMTNPSSKYDAEGVGGIINLKTSRIQNSGFSGSVNAGTRFGRKMGYNGGVDLNYRHEKFTVYGTLSAFEGQNVHYIDGYTRYADGSFNEINGAAKNSQAGSNRYLSFFGKGGVDYYISRTDVLSLTYKGHGSSGKSNSGLFNRFLPESGSDSVLYAYRQDAKSAYDVQNHNVNLNYEHTFDTIYGRKLSVNADWIYNSQMVEGNNRIGYYYNGALLDGPASATDGYSLDQPLFSNIYNLKMDYEHPFNMRTRLEAGIKFSYANNNNKQFYKIFDSAESTSNRYLYDEIIGAAYVMVNHTFKTRTTLQVGVRAEYTHTRGNNIDMDSINTNGYIRPFPNVTISQPVGNKNQLSLSYRYRLTRPDYSSLNPFVLRSEANVYRCGNPYLKPEYSHNLDLTYSYNYQFFATVSYVHTDGTKQELSTFDEFYNQYTYPANAGKSDRLDVSLSTQLNFFNIWRLQVFLNGSYGNSTILYNGRQESSRIFSSGYWINTEVDAHPHLTVSAYSWGQMPNRSLFTRTEGMYGGGIGLKAFFLDKTLTISASFDISSAAYTITSTYPGADGRDVINYANYGWDRYTGRVSLSYRFGNNKLMNRRPRHIKDADESSRLGGQSGGGAGSPVR